MNERSIGGVVDNPRLRALAAQVVGAYDGVVLKRGCTEIHVAGANADVVLSVMLARLTEGATADEIAGAFPEPDRLAVLDLLAYLRERRIVVEVDSPEGAVPERPETEIDIFHWEFGLTTEAVERRLSADGVAVIGLNRISRALVRALIEQGTTDVRVFDYPPLRNLYLFDEDGRLDPALWPDSLPAPALFTGAEDTGAFKGCGTLAATSDFGGQKFLLPWNRICLEQDINFLPVVLQNLVGWIGPLVVPGRTACLACARAREDANMNDPALSRATEPVAQTGQPAVSLAPAMADVLGALAALELHKFRGGLRGAQTGRLIEVNTLITELKTHRVLRVPRCPACSSLYRHSTVGIDRRTPTLTRDRKRA